ncbi:MAG: right-handed parallel beta-helix repeat-containing protein [Planctomycetota bacterium]
MCSQRQRVCSAIGLIAFVAGSASASDFYVRVTGNDAYAGNSATAAFRTVQHAIDQAIAGDTIYVGGGTYTESLTLSKDGTVTDPIRIEGDINGTHTGDAGEIVIQSSASRTLYGSGIDHVHFADLTLSGGSDTVYLSGGQGLRFESVHFTGASDDLVVLMSDAEATITGSRFSDSGDEGVYAYDGVVTVDDSEFDITGVGVYVVSSDSSALVSNSEFTGGRYVGGSNYGELRFVNILGDSPSIDGVQLLSSSASAEIWFSTFLNSGDEAIDTRGGDLTVYNTIISGTGQYGIQLSSSPTFDHGSNVIYGTSSTAITGSGSGLVATETTTDPGLTDARAGVGAGSSGAGIGATPPSWVTDLLPTGFFQGAWNAGYFDPGYNAGASATRPAAGDLSVAYFHDQAFALDVSDVDWRATPDHEMTASSVSWANDGSAMYTGGPDDELAVRIRGTLIVPESGEWEFMLGSEDSAMLLVNGRVIVDSSSIHSWNEVTNTTWLPAGEHRVQLFYLERSGDQGLELSWQGPSDASPELIPAANFDPWRGATVASWSEHGFDRTMIARLRAAAVEQDMVELGSDAYNGMNTIRDALDVFGADSLDDVRSIVEIAEVPE